MGSRGRRIAVFIAALVSAGAFQQVRADEPPAPAGPPPVPVHVVLPAGYDDPANAEVRYPVLYLFNTAWDTCAPADCQPFLDALADKPLITVYEAESHYVGDYADWHNGAHAYEADHLALADWVDGQYRTVADRDHRIVAGTSAGGYGAALLATHHPDRFGTLATFSGIVDIMGRGPASQAVFDTMGRDPFATDPFSVWGTPVADDAYWHANNPADHAAALADTAVFHGAGPGVPCSPDDIGPDNLPGIENIVRDSNETFEAALTAAGVAHTYLRLDCGVHKPAYFLEQFTVWLDGLVLAD